MNFFFAFFSSFAQYIITVGTTDLQGKLHYLAHFRTFDDQQVDEITVIKVVQRLQFFLPIGFHVERIFFE